MEHPFAFRPNTLDAQIFDSVVNHNEYRLPASFGSEDIVIDIGAHIGSFSYAVLQRGVKHVYTFEAERSNYERVLYNLRDFSDRVTVMNKAVWRSDKPVEYIYFQASADERNTGGGGVVFADNTVRVDAIAFDEVMRLATEDGKRRVRMLKIDCEGAEFPILLTSKWLSQIDCICGEFHELASEIHPYDIPEHARVPGFDEFSAEKLAEYLEQAGFHMVFERAHNSHMGLFFARHVSTYAIPEESQRQPFDAQQRWSRSQIRQRLAAVQFWDHQVEVAPGMITHGQDHTLARLPLIGLPSDLRGKRVLDVGAGDGFFSFECERRGAAEVVALDLHKSEGFEALHELFDSRVCFQQGSVYDLSPEELGTFDLVLCLGLLHRLRHPLLALERLRAVCYGALIVETAICDEAFIDDTGAIQQLEAVAPSLAATPLMQFYPTNERNHDYGVWWSPNRVGLASMLYSAGFAPHQEAVRHDTICVHALSVARPEHAGEVLIQRAVGSPEHHPPIQQDHELMRVFVQQYKDIMQLQSDIKLRERQIASLQERAQWLEDVANAARRNLEAVEQGRVMRLLRRFAVRK
jgi:tRNA (mo5U34)-methyltransferase